MDIKLYSLEKDKKGKKVPLFVSSVVAGKPIYAEDYVDSYVDLMELIVEHPASTLLAQVKSLDLEDSIICDNDILVIDTSIEPKDGSIVLAELNGEYLVRYIRFVDGQSYLQKSNNQFLPVKMEPFLEYNIVGVVTKVIHSV